MEAADPFQSRAWASSYGTAAPFCGSELGTRPAPLQREGRRAPARREKGMGMHGERGHRGAVFGDWLPHAPYNRLSAEYGSVKAPSRVSRLQNRGARFSLRSSPAVGEVSMCPSPIGWRVKTQPRSAHEVSAAAVLQKS